MRQQSNLEREFERSRGSGPERTFENDPQPTKMRTSALAWIAFVAAIVFLAVTAGVLISNRGPSTQSQPSAAAAKPSPKKSSCDKSVSKQTGRREAIDEMIDKYHALSKVEKPGDVVHVYVSAPFYAAKFDTKQSLMELVYCYYYDDDESIVRIFDDSSGKQVGRFSVGLGLELDR